MTAPQKLYLNYEIKVRECGKCHAILSFDKFTMLQTGIPRSTCKKCRTAAAAEKNTARRVKEAPQLFHWCKTCNHYWKKLAGDVCSRCGTRVILPKDKPATKEQMMEFLKGLEQ